MAADNPFETATELVGSLRADYDQLNNDIPKLRETKNKIVGDLEDLNKEVVIAQTQLSDLEVKIKNQTIAYNTWQAGELKKLADKEVAFTLEKSEIHKKQSLRDTDLNNRERAVTTDRRNLTTSMQRVKDTQKSADDQHTANQNWAKQLADKEQVLKDREAAINDREGKLDARSVDLDHRETKVISGENAVKQATEDAERDRSTARTLLKDAKDSIASNDAREDALGQRKRLLDNKEAELKKKEAALKDRTSIAIANGTLPH